MKTYVEQYFDMFGVEEPLWDGPCFFADQIAERENIAKKCVEANKTAIELGLYKIFSRNKDVII